MSENLVKTSGTTKNYKDDRGGATIVPSAIIGIVKHNIDNKRSGIIQVYLKRLDGGDENNPDNWTSARYLSPFFGTTPNTSSSDDLGTFKGNPHSYGMWFTPPDLNTEVVCVCINGNINETYYIGSIPQIGLMHMVPAIGSNESVIPNDGEAQSFGGATRLPVGEINNANKSQDDNPLLINQPRPVHSYQAAILNKQGLIRDPDRGTISSSSVRESPSKVFGISTPGRAIYEGGYGGKGQKSIGEAVKDNSIPDKNFKVVGRLGGHTLVMDDGDIDGKDQLFRLRTATGHMIMMNDTIQTLFIIHANGQSYIELGKEGTIDMYSTNSVNIRTQGDLNLHADNNININAGKDLNISAENIKIESSKETTQFSGTTFKQQTKGNHTVKVDAGMSFESKGDSSVKSGGTNYLNGGPNIKLNTGASPLVPQDVKPLAQTAHTDTLFDDVKGYAAAPARLISITSRAPAHSPWTNANQGVNVKTNVSAAANLPKPPSPLIQAANNSTSNTPVNPTSPEVAATVPTTNSSAVDKQSNNALVSQVAVNASSGSAKDAVVAGAGVVDNNNGSKSLAVGPLALDTKQLEGQGVIKPGTANAIDAALAAGKSIPEALPANFFTGKDGVTSVSSLVNNVPAQVSTISGAISTAKDGLVKSGVISGNESPTQTGGLLLSAVTVGITKTVDFVKSAFNGSASAVSAPAAIPTNFGQVVNPYASAGQPPDIKPDDAAKIKEAIASGNKAATMADQTTGPLSGVEIKDKLKDAATNAWDKVTSSFKALKGKVEQNLTAINAKNKEEKAATEEAAPASASTEPTSVDNPWTGKDPKKAAAWEKLTPDVQKKLGQADPTDSIIVSRVSQGDSFSLAGVKQKLDSLSTSGAAGKFDNLAASADASGISGLTGGGGAISTLINLGSKAKSLFSSPTPSASADSSAPSVPGTPSVPGSSSITSALSSLKENINGGISNLKAKLNKNNDNLQDVASKDLSPAENAKLAGALNSVSGATSVKLPTVAAQTFDFGPMMAQAGTLLGDNKIPALDLGGGPASSFSFATPTAAQAEDYNKLKKDLKYQEDLQWDLRKKYFENKTKYSETDSKTVAAKEEWQTCVKKIDEIRGQMYTNTTGNPAPAVAQTGPVDVNENLTNVLGMQKGGPGQTAVQDIGSAFKKSIGV